MADTADTPTSVADESPAQRQARLRREKRNAKIAAEGNDRLSKITQLNGRIAPAAPTSKPASASVADDPDEVDISDHHWTPQSRTPNALQTQQNPFMGLPNFPGGGAGGGAGDPNGDPMMQMMQQMLGGGGFGGGQQSGGAGGSDGAQDPMMQMMQQMMGGQQKAQADAAAPKSNSAYVWRIVHAVLSLGLALYIALTSTFNGSKMGRAQSVGDGAGGVGFGPRLFYLFATTELVLQSSRYFLEKGQLQGSGMLATVANMGIVPEPWAGYLRVAGRYYTIWTTVVADATTIVFVLGLLALWKGM